MPFGGWSISEELFNKIREILPAPKIILELGSGIGTEELLKFYTVYSIESNEKYIGRCATNYIHAPMKRHKPYSGYSVEKYGGSGDNMWYDADVLRRELPKVPKYDLLLIDGPPSTRSGIIKYFDLFDMTVPIVLDDLHRTLERKILHDLSKRTGRPYTVYGAYERKSFGVIL